LVSRQFVIANRTFRRATGRGVRRTAVTSQPARAFQLPRTSGRQPAGVPGTGAGPDNRLRGDPFLDDAAISAAVARSGLAVAHVNLATRRVVSVSESAAALLGATGEQVVGRPVTDFVDDEPSGGLPLLATGRLDGFEAARRLRRCDGEVVEAYVWAHVLGTSRPAPSAAAFVAVDGQPPGPRVETRTKDSNVIGTVDPEWRVDRVSVEVGALLGYRVADLAGAPLLTAVHPGDLAGLLTGLAHVHATGRNAMIRIRLRHAEGGWLWCRAALASLDDPPRFAFTLRPFAAAAGGRSERARDLELRLTRIAHEIRAAGFIVPSAGSPSLDDLPELATLTSREWHVVTRLAQGARVPAIAGELALSPSTVRNHLSAVFRKLGVGSQSELLQRLRSAPRSAEPS
jgi:DNA-binding CsgD family transcriptional regulator/PAS domain-containing protein